MFGTLGDGITLGKIGDGHHLFVGLSYCSVVRSEKNNERQSKKVDSH
jgi:hypothetical protein